MSRLIIIIVDRSVAALILGVAIAIFMQMSTPILFIQDRLGKDGRIFKFSKSRTITDARNSNGKLLSDDRLFLPIVLAKRVFKC